MEGAIGMKRTGEMLQISRGHNREREIERQIENGNSDMEFKSREGAKLQTSTSPLVPNFPPKQGGHHVSAATLEKSAPVALWTCGARLN